MGTLILFSSIRPFSGSVIDTVIKTGNLRTVPVECHGDDTSLILHDTSLSSILILLVYFSKFNIYDSPIILPLRLAYLNEDTNTPFVLEVKSRKKLWSKLIGTR